MPLSHAASSRRGFCRACAAYRTRAGCPLACAARSLRRCIRRWSRSSSPPSQAPNSTCVFRPSDPTIRPSVAVQPGQGFLTPCGSRPKIRVVTNDRLAVDASLPPDTSRELTNITWRGSGHQPRSPPATHPLTEGWSLCPTTRSPSRSTVSNAVRGSRGPMMP